MRHKDDMLNSIIKEIELSQDFLSDKHLTSIYFGGGTPSLLDASEIEMVLAKLDKHYSWSDDIEMTLEANPDDIKLDKIKELRSAGINRLSIGIQSFIDTELLASNRAHSASESLEAVAISRTAGIDNLSIDLIYGMPDSTEDTWQYNIDQALQLEVDHISSYALTVEPNTALAHMVSKEKVSLPSEHTISEQYIQLIDALNSKSYDHYEISNFALPGRYAVHNTNYWKSVAYLGLGPSAHSYKNDLRQWNIANNAQYIASINAGIIPSEVEQIKYEDGFNEYVMTRLRTMWGVDIQELRRQYPNELGRVAREIKPYVSSDRVVIEDDHYRLTPAGRLMADRIASDLFLV